MNTSQPVVQVSGVSKFFGGVVAISEVSFNLQPGVTAMLGPNGAGKSTLMRMIAGLESPSVGTIEVLGANPRTDVSIRGRMGLVPQQDALFDRLTAAEFVGLAAATHGVADPVHAAAQALGHVDLDPNDTRPCRSYSKGMRQRVKVAQAIVHDPELIILDEPLTGLDPLQRRGLIDLFRTLGEQGRCVVVSSHVLDEVARIGSNVLVIAQGRLAATGDFRAIRGLMDDRPRRIRVVCDQPARLAAALVGAEAAMGIRIDGNSVVVDTNDIDVFGRQIAPLAVSTGTRVREVRPLDDDLESVFRYLVERS